MIACLLLPFFAAAVERRANPALTAAPLVIAETAQSAGRVVAVSAEAAACGLKPGLSLRQAELLCPQARFIPAHPTQYQQTLTELLVFLAATFTPKVEADEGHPLAALIYLDLGEPLPRPLEWVHTIGQQVQAQSHLTPALGLATGKFSAYIAAGSIGLNRLLVIAPGQEGSFLAPLPVRSLPLEPELARRFSLLGLRTLGQVAALPAGAVLAQFGPAGRRLHQLARGEDDRPVRPYPLPPRLQATRQFDSPVADRAVLLANFRSLAESLAGRLHRQRQLSRTVRLRLELEAGAPVTERLSLPQPGADPDRLARVLAALLARLQIDAGVLAITVELADLVPATGRQLDLFVHRSEQAERLEQLLPDLVRRYGPDRFYRAAIVEAAACLPERRFRLEAVEAK